MASEFCFIVFLFVLFCMITWVTIRLQLIKFCLFVFSCLSGMWRWRSRLRCSRFWRRFCFIDSVFLLDVVHLAAVVLILCCCCRFSSSLLFVLWRCSGRNQDGGWSLMVFLCHRWIFRIWGTPLLLNHPNYPLSSFCWHSVSFTFGLKCCRFWNIGFLPLGILWNFAFYPFCSSYSFRSSCVSTISHFLYSCVQLLGSH